MRLDIDDLWLRPGLGGHEMRFQIKLQAPWLPDDDSHEVLHLQVHIEAGNGSTPRPLGEALLTCHVRRFPTPEHLRLVISDDQLLGLESIRGQGAIHFQLDATTTLFERDHQRPLLTATQIGHTMMPGRWLELLDQVGAGVAITVRVPSPLTDGTVVAPGSPSASLAARRLREARRALLESDYEGCVQTCRSALDNLKELAPPSSINELKAAAPQSRNQAQRWSALFHDLYSLGSGANHDDDVTRNFAWTRVDAQAALAMTAALLARALDQPFCVR